MITKFITRLLQDEPPTIYGDGTQTRDFVFVSDVVQAMLLAMTERTATGHVFNIGTGTPASVKTLFSIVSELTGSAVEPRYAPSRSRDTLHSAASIQKTQAVLGYRPHVSLREGLAQTLTFYKR